ncbi:MAG: endonuclease/exonuclease/phosphatase family protein [Eikenella sp.]|nr:endonuclease/exonuclease/phosphatase family protein [Eikenella sp.]
MPAPVTVTTYNIHKGMSPLNRKLLLPQMADALQSIAPDVLFLQEVQGEHRKRLLTVPDFPAEPHDELLGRLLSYHRSYGRNAVFKDRHHGNAILSRLPLTTKYNLDVSVNRLEQRGILHCEIQPPGWRYPLVCLCAHLNLREPDRRKQYRALYDYIHRHIPHHIPLVLAGDFNDWRHQSCRNLGQVLGLDEAFLRFSGSRPKTFPARLPVLSLDRIYTRHLTVLDAVTYQGKPWQLLSDHLPLSATVVPR